ncbi:hypothetical protein [Actinomadura litoris]|uniref:hypothetical protein n=1 Tax=Actinomadura litoris TaxID=2678616 RepID=UPI001FA7979E|nr:hypothetical protein [Actinomadura litoris]
MAENPEAKRWQELVDEMGVVYNLIRYVLLHLPLKIELAHFDKDWDAEDVVPALRALNRARLLIDDQPIEDRHKQLLKEAILDWLAVYDLSAIFMMAGDPLACRLDGAEHLLRRAQFAAGTVAYNLGIGRE